MLNYYTTSAVSHDAFLFPPLCLSLSGRRGELHPQVLHQEEEWLHRKEVLFRCGVCGQVSDWSSFHPLPPGSFSHFSHLISYQCNAKSKLYCSFKVLLLIYLQLTKTIKSGLVKLWQYALYLQIKNVIKSTYSYTVHGMKISRRFYF